MKPERAQWLAQGLIERRLPSASWAGEREVRQGILLGRMLSTFGERLARRTALNVQRALLGDEPAEMPVEYPAPYILTTKKEYLLKNL